MRKLPSAANCIFDFTTIFNTSLFIFNKKFTNFQVDKNISYKEHMEKVAGNISTAI